MNGVHHVQSFTLELCTSRSLRSRRKREGDIPSFLFSFGSVSPHLSLPRLHPLRRLYFAPSPIFLACSISSLDRTNFPGYRPRYTCTAPVGVTQCGHLGRSYHSLMETRWPSGLRARLRIERFGLEPWPGHCVVFMGKTLYRLSQIP